ncbi:MAG: amidohydrolase family protein, partial [Antricoccus sp.]
MSYFHADRIVIGGQVLVGGWLRSDDGWIGEIGSGKVPSNSHYLGELLLPGFVDIHCHGGAGHSFTDGAAAAQEVAEFHLHHGTTSMLASTVSTAIPELIDQIHELAAHITGCQNQPIKGIHLEGPFLSSEYRGAHKESLLREPEPSLVAQLLAAGPISMV